MAKTYPREELRQVELSTVLACSRCGKPNAVHESVMFDDATNKMYHLSCASSKTESRIVSMELGDSFGVKSE